MHVRSLSGASRYTKSSSCSPIGFCTKQPHVQPKVFARTFCKQESPLRCVCMYAQVPQHFAISLIFRATVDNKKISVEVLPIGPCIYRIFLSCPSTCGFGLQVSFAYLSYMQSRGTQSTQSSLRLQALAAGQDWECHIRKTNSRRFQALTRDMPTQVGKNKLIVTNRQKTNRWKRKVERKNYSPSFFLLFYKFLFLLSFYGLMRLYNILQQVQAIFSFSTTSEGLGLQILLAILYFIKSREEGKVSSTSRVRRCKYSKRSEERAKRE